MSDYPGGPSQFLRDSAIMQKILEQNASQRSREAVLQQRSNPYEAQRQFESRLQNQTADIRAWQGDAVAKQAETQLARRGIAAAPIPSQSATRNIPIAIRTAPSASSVASITSRATAIASAIPGIDLALTIDQVGRSITGSSIDPGLYGIASRAWDKYQKNRRREDPTPQIGDTTQIIPGPGGNFTGGQSAGVAYTIRATVYRTSTGVTETSNLTTAAIGPIQSVTPYYDGLGRFYIAWVAANPSSPVSYGFFTQLVSLEVFRTDGQPDTSPTPTPSISPDQQPQFPAAAGGTVPNLIPTPAPAPTPTPAPVPAGDPAPSLEPDPEAVPAPVPAPAPAPTPRPSPGYGIQLDPGNAISIITAGGIVAITTNKDKILPGGSVDAIPKTATETTPVVPPPGPPPTITPNKCPCNTPVMDKLDKLSAGIDAADLALLAAIKADTTKIRTGVGADDFPGAVPAHLHGASGATRNIANLADQNIWLVEALDSVLGAYPNKTTIQAPDGSLSELLGDNISEDLAEIKGMLMGLTIDSAEILHTSTRTLQQAGSATHQAHLAQLYAKGNAEFLGYEAQPASTDLPLTYTPGANPFQGLLSESTSKIQGWKNTDGQDLKAILYELLHAAAIIRSLYWRKLDPRKDIQGQLKDLVKTQTTGLDKIDGNGDNDWEQYLTRVEEGFSGNTGDTTPYGRDQSERPKIRDVGADNSAP